MLIAICIVGVALGANVCDHGELCSLQDDNADLVQTTLRDTKAHKSRRAHVGQEPSDGSESDDPEVAFAVAATAGEGAKCREEAHSKSNDAQHQCREGLVCVGWKEGGHWGSCQVLTYTRETTCSDDTFSDHSCTGEDHCGCGTICRDLFCSKANVPHLDKPRVAQKAPKMNDEHLDKARAAHERSAAESAVARNGPAALQHTKDDKHLDKARAAAEGAAARKGPALQHPKDDKHLDQARAATESAAAKNGPALQHPKAAANAHPEEKSQVQHLKADSPHPDKLRVTKADAKLNPAYVPNRKVAKVDAKDFSHVQRRRRGESSDSKIGDESKLHKRSAVKSTTNFKAADERKESAGASKSSVSDHLKEKSKVRSNASSKSATKLRIKSAGKAKTNSTQGRRHGKSNASKPKRRSYSWGYVLDYYYYDYYYTRKELASMRFTLSGLDYDKIIADGQLHFDILFNIKEELAQDYSVDFDHVTVVMRKEGVGLLITSDVVCKKSAGALSNEIDQHILNRLNAIANIENGKTEAGGTIGFIGNGGVGSGSPTRRRRVPAPAPACTTVTCSWYMGQGVQGANDGAKAGEGTCAGSAVTFECADATHKKWPYTGQVTCGTGATWSPVSSGTVGSVTNWGCGVPGLCWERPRSSDGAVPTGLLVGNDYTQAPFAPVVQGARWCPGTATQSPCCPEGQVLTDSSGTDVTAGIECPTNSEDAGSYVQSTGILSCAAPAR